MNISSIVVRVLPANLTFVKAKIESFEGYEVYYQDDRGVLVVVIEGNSVDEELKKLRFLQEMENVASAEMMYSYSEDEIAQNMQHLKNGDVVPKILKEDTKTEDIVYGGDVRNLVK